MKDFIKLIENKSLGTFEENVSFKKLTTYKTGGTAKLLFMPKSVDSLNIDLSKIEFEKNTNDTNSLLPNFITDNLKNNQ